MALLRASSLEALLPLPLLPLALSLSSLSSCSLLVFEPLLKAALLVFEAWRCSLKVFEAWRPSLALLDLFQTCRPS